MLSNLLRGEAPLPPVQLPLESALLPEEPVASFVFQRSIVSFNSKRRSGDPPCRYLELRYGLVDPFSHPPTHCSNPRASGGLKQWYQKAKHWKVLHSDFRPTLVLGQDRRRFDPSSKAKPDKLAQPLKPKNSPTGSSSRTWTENSPIGNDSSWRSQGKKTLTSGQSIPRLPLQGGGVPMVVEGSWARALGKSPRLIVIGDVHGCITELQQLLRLADYQPGDQVVLLGDLVAKGPDSVGVVQLAREIGARTVRGNHDFEVVRWWEAQTRGDQRAMVSMEHARIARSLGADEHAWLVDAPWFIECAEMGHLFVHAGFIPGVKLTQQNPRLMMNMRSVLGDGTVTAKNVVDCEWAKLWRGPQTVVFGHDAFRGLQQYEYATGIDTGCVYGGRLTALLLPENRMISVAARREYISPKKFRGAVRPFPSE